MVTRTSFFSKTYTIKYGGRIQFVYSNGEFIRRTYMPDLVKGDLDSIRGDVKKYYASKVMHLALQN